LADSFYESFDNGTGALGNAWGNGLDTSVKGQITLDGSHGGLMQHASGANAGFGYGSYTLPAKVEGDQVGPAALLWPSDDRWPGTEIDFVEVLPNGTAYGTAHNGNNGYDWYEFPTGSARPTGNETCGRLARSVGGEVGLVMVRTSPRMSWTRDA